MHCIYKGKVYQASNFMGRCWLPTDRIPGWISPEPAVWFRYIPFNEIEKAWIVKTDAKTKESTYAEVDTADLKVLCNVEALGELAQKYIRKKAE